MLPYHAYYEALAAIGNPAHPEWYPTAAGLATLRLIDDWLHVDLDLQRRERAAHDIARTLIEQIPPIDPIKPILGQLLEEITRAERATLESIAAPMFLYTRRLHSHGRYTLANNALSPLLQHALRAHQSNLIIQLSMRLAVNDRLAGDYASAEDHYGIASIHARTINDDRSYFRAEAGYAKILVARGELDRAQTLYSDIESNVRMRGDLHTLRLVIHDQVTIASLHEDKARMLQLVQDAIACAPASDPDDHDAAQIDLALSLLELGRLEESRPITVRASVLASDYSLRKRAALVLLRTAVLERNKQNFHQYRSALSLGPLPPILEIQYRGEAARGLQIFGDVTGAQQELEIARDVAKRSQVHTMFMD